MAAPRYGLSIPDRGVLYGVTTVGQILDQAAQAERECAPVGVKLSERGPRLGEGITILRRLWSEDAVCHEGPFHRFRDLTLEPKPVQRPGPPIWIATNPTPEAAPPVHHRPGLAAPGPDRRRLDDEPGASGPLPRAVGLHPWRARPGRAGRRAHGIRPTPGGKYQ